MKCLRMLHETFIATANVRAIGTIPTKLMEIGKVTAIELPKREDDREREREHEPERELEHEREREQRVNVSMSVSASAKVSCECGP